MPKKISELTEVEAKAYRVVERKRERSRQYYYRNKDRILTKRRRRYQRQKEIVRSLEEEDNGNEQTDTGIHGGEEGIPECATGECDRQSSTSAGSVPGVDANDERGE